MILSEEHYRILKRLVEHGDRPVDNPDIVLERDPRKRQSRTLDVMGRVFVLTHPNPQQTTHALYAVDTPVVIVSSKGNASPTQDDSAGGDTAGDDTWIVRFYHGGSDDSCVDNVEFQGNAEAFEKDMIYLKVALS